MFARLEIDYEESDTDPTSDAVQKTQQTLTFYKLTGSGIESCESTA
jgi:splicing factor 3B subunit 3